MDLLTGYNTEIQKCLPVVESGLNSLKEKLILKPLTFYETQFKNINVIKSFIYLISPYASVFIFSASYIFLSADSSR